jgi:hypothetical protein
MKAAASPSPVADLFGYVRPASPPPARRSSVSKATCDARIDELHDRYHELLDDLRTTIESAIETFTMAMVDYTTDEYAGDIDRLVELLDEEISDAIGEARRTIIL